MHAKYVSKANWSKGELKRIQKMLTAQHGSGPRAQQEVQRRIAAMKRLDASGRAAVRRQLGVHARRG